MISVEQIKAARGLLEWTQDDLAKSSGVSKLSINKLERRVSNPTKETLGCIRKALEKAGVEFTEGPGIKLRGSILKTQIFEGSDSLLRLLRDVFETLNGTDHTLMISGVSEQQYQEVGGKRVVDEIKKRIKHNIKAQLLICEGDTNLLEPESHYRQVPKEFFSRTPYYIYENKYAIFLWGPPQKVVLIENAEITECFRQQFKAHWAAGKKVIQPY